MTGAGFTITGRAGRVLAWPLAVLLLSGAGPSAALAATYHVDAAGGNDSRDGLSEATAWATLEKVNARTYLPGDRILLKRGSVWNAARLAPPGSGALGAPIVVSAYGSGALPVINGTGAHTSTVYLQNQQYWEVENLEVTNLHPANGRAVRYGVRVRASDIGAVRHLVFRNLVVRDVNGNLAERFCGGMFFEVAGTATPTWFDSLIVEGCDVSEVSPVGVQNVSSWDTRTLTTNTDWTPSLNVILRGNTIRRTGRNGMIVRVARRPLIEWNVFEECGKDSTGNAVYPFNCDSALIQYNEASLTRYNAGDDDGAGIDADYRCKSTIIQYNYIHDNEYGGIVIVSDGNGSTTFNDGTIVRYNVLKNNRSHGIRTSGNVTNTRIHNNTIYTGSSSGAVILVWHKSWGGYSSNTQYHDNIFETQASGCSYSLGSSIGNVFDYNLFHGVATTGEPADAHKLTADPQFADVPSTGTGWATAAGFALPATSPAVNSGVAVPGHPARDYLGNPVPSGGQVDRGAFEYQAAVPQPGACCTPGGDCVFVTEAECAAQSGAFRGVGVTCTSGLCDAPSHPVRISQVYGGGSGGTFSCDYVELFNSSEAPVDIGGWSVQYGSSTGSSFGSSTYNLARIPGGATIPACGYYLIRGYCSTAGAALPVTPDLVPATGWIFNFSGTDGKVALFSDQVMGRTCAQAKAAATFEDMVGYGAANCHETAAAVTLDASSVLVRGGGGMTDTDDNSADFSKVAASGVTIHNSSSAPNPACQQGANAAPDVPTLIVPLNGAIDVAVPATLEVTVSDPDADALTVQFYGRAAVTSPPGQAASATLLADFALLGTVAGVPSGSTADFYWDGLEPLTEHEWYVTLSDGEASPVTGPTWSFTTEAVSTDVGDRARGGLSLAPPAPNPARGALHCAFDLPRAMRVRLDVVDVQGRVVATLAEGGLGPGHHERSWDASAAGGPAGAGAPAGAGLYFIRLVTPRGRLVRRVALLQ
jgi:hypothetical protein